MSAREAPLSRDLVDIALPWLRAGLGIAFIAFSANSTIFISAADQLWLFEATRQITIGAFADAYWYAAAFALVLFIGEVATGEKYPRVYRLFLIPDAIYTARGVWVGLSKALIVLIAPWLGDGAAGILGPVLAAPFAFWLGYLIAKWGEILLFGRRRTRGAKKET